MYCFKILSQNSTDRVIPLVYALNEGRVSFELLNNRFADMRDQNYECAVIELDDEIIGVTGLWFCTRHYCGKSVELDHVFIRPDHRSKGLGARFMEWIENYVHSKGVKSIELNTYVTNYPSHKFYCNQGFEILGYHFLKNI